MNESLASNYIDIYREFFKSIVEKDPCKDLEFIRTSFVRLQNTEVVGSISHWASTYLLDNNCPPELIGLLVKSIVDRTRSICKKNPNIGGFDCKNTCYDTFKLVQLVFKNIRDVCVNYLDNKYLDTLPEPTPSDFRPISRCSIKNLRRKLEDKLTIIHDLNEMFEKNADEIIGFYGVYDGHITHHAATYCSEHLHQFLVESEHFPHRIEEALVEAFHRTDRMFEEKCKSLKIHGGTTVVCALHKKQSKKLTIAWTGDSQAILVENSQVVQLVVPHKPSNQREEARINAAGGSVVSICGIKRVNGLLSISRAIGDFEFRPSIIPDPEVLTIYLKGSEDFLVLACDGLWEHLSEIQVSNYIYEYLELNNGSVGELSVKLAKLAKERGSCDNITIIVVFLKDLKDISRTMEASLESSNTLDSFLSDLNSTMATVATSTATNESSVLSSVSTENYSLLKSRSDIEEDSASECSGNAAAGIGSFDPFVMNKSSNDNVAGTNGTGFDSIDFVTIECKPSAPVEAKNNKEALLTNEEVISHGNYFSDSESNSLVMQQPQPQPQQQQQQHYNDSTQPDTEGDVDVDYNNESTIANASTLTITQDNFSDLHFDDDGYEDDNSSKNIDSSTEIQNISSMTTSSFQFSFNMDDKLLSFDNGSHVNDKKMDNYDDDDDNDDGDDQGEDDENEPFKKNAENPKKLDESTRNQTRNECEEALNETDSEDEWNYYPIVKKSESSSSVIERNHPPSSDLKSEQQLHLQHISNNEEDMLSNEETESRLNPNAAEFVPQSPKRNPIENFFNDPIISQSPKGVPLDLNIRNFSEKEIINDLKCMPSDTNVQLEQIKDVYGNMVINSLFAVKKNDGPEKEEEEEEEEKDNGSDSDDAVIDLNKTRELPTNFEYEEKSAVENDKENDQPETSDMDVENGKMNFGAGDGCDGGDGDDGTDGDGDGNGCDTDYVRCNNNKNDFSTNTTTESISRSFEEIENCVKNLSVSDEMVKSTTELNDSETMAMNCGFSADCDDGTVNGNESYASHKRESQTEIDDYVLLPADVSVSVMPPAFDDFKVVSQISEGAIRSPSAGSNDNLVMEIADEYEIVNNESCISVQENQQMFDGLDRDGKNVEVAAAAVCVAKRNDEALVDLVSDDVVVEVKENGVHDTSIVSSPNVDLESSALTSSSSLQPPLRLSDSQVADMEAAAHCLVDMKSNAVCTTATAEQLSVTASITNPPTACIADGQVEEVTEAVSGSSEIKTVTSAVAETVAVAPLTTEKQSGKSVEKNVKKPLGQQPRKSLTSVTKSATAVAVGAKKPLATASKTTLTSTANARSKIAAASDASGASGTSTGAAASRNTTLAQRATTKSKTGPSTAAPVRTTNRTASATSAVSGATGVTKTATTASTLSRAPKSSTTASSIVDKRVPLSSSKRTTASTTSTTTTTTMSSAFGSSKRTVTGMMGSYSAIGKSTSAKTQVSSVSLATKRPVSRPAATMKTATTETATLISAAPATATATATASKPKRTVAATTTSQIRVKTGAMSAASAAAAATTTTTTTTASRRTAPSTATSASSSPLSNGLNKQKVSKASTTTTAATASSVKKLSATSTAKKTSSVASRTTSTFARKTDTTTTKSTGSSATTVKKPVTTVTAVASSVPKAVPRNLAPKAAASPTLKTSEGAVAPVAPVSAVALAPETSDTATKTVLNGDA